MGTHCQPAPANAGASGEPLGQMFPTKTAVAVSRRVAASPPPPELRDLGPCHLLQLPAIGPDSQASTPRRVSAAAVGRGPGAAPRPDGRLASCVHGRSACTTAVASCHPRARDRDGPERGSEGRGAGAAAPKCLPGAAWDSPSWGVGGGPGALNPGLPTPSSEAPPPALAHPYLGGPPRLPQAAF